MTATAADRDGGVLVAFPRAAVEAAGRMGGTGRLAALLEHLQTRLRAEGRQLHLALAAGPPGPAAALAARACALGVGVTALPAAPSSAAEAEAPAMAAGHVALDVDGDADGARYPRPALQFHNAFLLDGDVKVSQVRGSAPGAAAGRASRMLLPRRCLPFPLRSSASDTRTLRPPQEWLRPGWAAEGAALAELCRRRRPRLLLCPRFAEHLALPAGRVGGAPVAVFDWAPWLGGRAVGGQALLREAERVQLELANGLLQLLGVSALRRCVRRRRLSPLRPCGTH